MGSVESEEGFQEALERNPHLSRYVDRLAAAGEDFPDYYTQLSREMRYLDRVNLIYPIGDPFFIHIKSTESEGWNRYIVIQPEIPSGSWGGPLG